MEIIVPAAGLSTRFPNMRPKYTLTDHNGDIMLKSAIKPFLNDYSITIGILKEHDQKYKIKDLLDHQFNKNINVVILENPTTGPADTVYQIIKKINLSSNKEIFIKDCDSFFEHSYMPGNYICVSQFSDNEIIRKPGSKSYIVSNENGIVHNIMEKQVISDKFCVGGYKFEESKLFVNAFEKLSKENQEIYVSNVIQYCLFSGSVFLENIVTDYFDVGTSDDWFRYNDKAVIFCDIDGTIIEAQPKNEYETPAVPLTNNVKLLKARVNSGDDIIFTTSRPEHNRLETEKTLKNLGFINFQLLMGLKNCKRILINDYNEANPYPRAVAINIKRNSDSIGDYL